MDPYLGLRKFFSVGVSISSTFFYVRIFRTNVVSAAFSSYVLALARKKLMKLTGGLREQKKVGNRGSGCMLSNTNNLLVGVHILQLSRFASYRFI